MIITTLHSLLYGYLYAQVEQTKDLADEVNVGNESRVMEWEKKIGKHEKCNEQSSMICVHRACTYRHQGDSLRNKQAGSG